jgi:hypothetical protein
LKGNGDATRFRLPRSDWSRGTIVAPHGRRVPNGRCVAVCDVYEPNLKLGKKDAGSNPQEYKDYRQVLTVRTLERS